MEVGGELVDGGDETLPVPEEKMFEKTEMIIPPKNMTPMSVPQPIGLAAIRAPHFGQVSAFELTSVPHSLHLMSAIVVLSSGNWEMPNVKCLAKTPDILERIAVYAGTSLLRLCF